MLVDPKPAKKLLFTNPKPSKEMLETLNEKNGWEARPQTLKADVA